VRYAAASHTTVRSRLCSRAPTAPCATRTIEEGPFTETVIARGDHHNHTLCARPAALHTLSWEWAKIGLRLGTLADVLTSQSWTRASWSQHQTWCLPIVITSCSLLAVWRRMSGMAQRRAPPSHGSYRRPLSRFRWLALTIALGPPAWLGWLISPARLCFTGDLSTIAVPHDRAAYPLHESDTLYSCSLHSAATQPVYLQTDSTLPILQDPLACTTLFCIDQ